MAAILTETSARGSGRDRLASARPVAWVRASGPLLSTHTLTLTPKVTVSGQGHENVETSNAIFSANSRRTDALLRALVRARDLRRIVQSQRRVLTPSNRGGGEKTEGTKLWDDFARIGGM